MEYVWRVWHYLLINFLFSWVNMKCTPSVCLWQTFPIKWEQIVELIHCPSLSWILRLTKCNNKSITFGKVNFIIFQGINKLLYSDKPQLWNNTHLSVFFFVSNEPAFGNNTWLVTSHLPVMPLCCKQNLTFYGNVFLH